MIGGLRRTRSPPRRPRGAQRPRASCGPCRTSGGRLHHAIRAGALRLPVRRPDARSLDHRIRVYCVDPYPVRASLLGETACEMQRRRLRRRIGGRVRSGDEGVLRADEHDRPAAALLDQHPECLPGGEEVPSREHRVILLPVLERCLSDRRTRCEPCRSDENVETAVFEHRLAAPSRPRFLTRDVDRRPLTRGECRTFRPAPSDFLCPFDVPIGNNDMGAASCEQPGGGTADPARAAGDERDLTREFLRGGACASLYRSSGQYSIANASLSLSERNPPSASAASSTAMARW